MKLNQFNSSDNFIKNKLHSMVQRQSSALAHHTQFLGLSLKKDPLFVTSLQIETVCFIRLGQVDYTFEVAVPINLQEFSDFDFGLNPQSGLCLIEEEVLDSVIELQRNLLKQMQALNLLNEAQLAAFLRWDSVLITALLEESSASEMTAISASYYLCICIYHELLKYLKTTFGI